MSTATVATATGLSREEMWAAFLGRDPRYDGRFVTGVRTTGIFCRPTCTCRKPRPERVEYFPSPRAAERAGYRPCKRCRPELAGGSREADARVVARALAVMRARIDEPLTLEALAHATATSSSRLARLFRAADGRTPMRALADLRAERAERLLASGEISVLDAALAAGFGSGSAFLRAFRRRTGRTPSAWRRSIWRGPEGREARVRGALDPAIMAGSTHLRPTLRTSLSSAGRRAPRTRASRPSGVARTRASRTSGAAR